MSDAQDLELIRETLRQIHKSTQIILKRFEPIGSPSDFIASDEGMEKLDASHHYFDIDAATVYTVCSDHVGELASTVQKMPQELA